MTYENITHKLLHDPAHQIDVRPTSRGPDYPYGVVITLDEYGRMRYQGRIGDYVTSYRFIERSAAILAAKIYNEQSKFLDEVAA